MFGKFVIAIATLEEAGPKKKKKEEEEAGPQISLIMKEKIYINTF